MRAAPPLPATDDAFVRTPPSVFRFNTDAASLGVHACAHVFALPLSCEATLMVRGTVGDESSIALPVRAVTRSVKPCMTDAIARKGAVVAVELAERVLVGVGVEEPEIVDVKEMVLEGVSVALGVGDAVGEAVGVAGAVEVLVALVDDVPEGVTDGLAPMLSDDVGLADTLDDSVVVVVGVLAGVTLGVAVGELVLVGETVLAGDGV